MRIQETKVYTFDELSEQAKETARNWYRSGIGEDTFWSEYVIDDAKRTAKILGIEIKDIYWSGFYSQGDGACFTGSYYYAKGSVTAITKEAPQDNDLHSIARALQALQRCYWYRLQASVSHRGHYSHAGCTDIEVFYDGDDNRKVSDSDVESLRDTLRDFMHWIYKSLEREWDFRHSQEVVDEEIAANEYEFTENGNRV